MTLSYLGSVKVGGAAPGASVAVAAGLSGINGALPNLEAQIAALLEFQPTDVDFLVQKQLALDVLASVQKSITLGLPVPSIGEQLLIVEAQVAAMLEALAAINASKTILVNLAAPLAVAGVHGYAYDGPVSAFGSELGAALAGGVPGGAPTDHASAVVFITTLPATWDAMSIIFKVSP